MLIIYFSIMLNYDVYLSLYSCYKIIAPIYENLVPSEIHGSIHRNSR